MITTRRSSDSSNYIVESDFSRSNVAVLERNEANCFSTVSNHVSVETEQETRARMQENLARLMNYDRYSEQVAEETACVETEIVNEASYSEEDYRPTSTTMQFGEGEAEQIYNELPSHEEEKTSYRLNGKGKLVVVLYALLVTVMLALITINAGIIPSLSGTVEAKAAELNGKVSIYNELKTENEYLTGSEHISNWAEQNGGIKM